MPDPVAEPTAPSSSTTGWAARYPLAVDIGLSAVAAVMFIPAALPLIRGSALGVGWVVTLCTAIALLHATIVVRRTSPLLAFGLAALGMLVLATAPMLRADGQIVPAVFLPSAVLFFVALYWAAESLDGALAVAALALSAVGAAGVIVRLALSPAWASEIAPGPSPWLLISALTAGGIIAAWSLGRLRRTRKAYLGELQLRLARAEADREAALAAAAADERAWITREMHDVVSHSLAVVATQAEGGRMLTDDPDARATLRTISGAARDALADMRSMLGVLQSESTDRGPAPGIADLPALLAGCRDAGQRVELHVAGTPKPLTSAASLAAYRIVQQSLTNALAHASGEPVSVTLTWTAEGLTIEVLNAVAESPPPRPGGRGLIGIRERAAAVGGSATCGMLRGQWQVHATIPAGGTR